MVKPIIVSLQTNDPNIRKLLFSRNIYIYIGYIIRS